MSIKVDGQRRDAASKMMSRIARERDLYLLQSAADYRSARRRRDGTQGAASPVRDIYNRDRDGEMKT
jgi:hypothetical protein